MVPDSLQATKDSVRLDVAFLLGDVSALIEQLALEAAEEADRARVNSRGESIEALVSRETG